MKKYIIHLIGGEKTSFQLEKKEEIKVFLNSKVTSLTILKSNLIQSSQSRENNFW